MITSVYKGISLRIGKQHRGARLVFILSTEKAMRTTQQAVWVPEKHFVGDSLKPDADIDYVFRRRPQVLVYAGYLEPIQGIVRRATIDAIIKNEKSRQEAQDDVK